MNNYEAITKMTMEQMEVFLDHVFLTGFNLGHYSANLPEDSEEQFAAQDSEPYNAEWLAAEAEDATRLVFTEDGDIYLPNAFCDVAFRIAGIDPSQSDGEENNTIDISKRGCHDEE